MVSYHKSIGKNEEWSIDVIGGVIEIVTTENVTYIKIVEDNNDKVIALRLKRGK